MTMTVLSTIPSSGSEGAAAPVEAEAPVADESSGGEVTPPSSSATEVEEPTPDPDLELSKKFDEMARREAKSRRAELAVQQKLKTADEHAKKAADILRQLEEDPVAYLLSVGKDPVDLVNRVTKPVTEEERRLKKLEDDQRRREEELTAREAKDKERREASERHQRMRKFVSQTNPDEYPYLTARWEAHELPGVVEQMLQGPNDADEPDGASVVDVFYMRHNRYPNDAEIRTALETMAEGYATKLVSRVEKRRQLASGADSAATGISGLSNQQASRNSAGSAPRALSREERMKKLKEDLAAEKR